MITSPRASLMMIFSVLCCHSFLSSPVLTMTFAEELEWDLLSSSPRLVILFAIEKPYTWFESSTLLSIGISLCRPRKLRISLSIMQRVSWRSDLAASVQIFVECVVLVVINRGGSKLFWNSMCQLRKMHSISGLPGCLFALVTLPAMLNFDKDQSAPLRS